jgi:hypothetical protein
MSYEGYTEHLCANGHHWAHDCYEDEKACPRCGKPSVWCHHVDQTNGVLECEDGSPDPSTIPYPLEVDHYERKRVTIKTPIYKIPDPEGAK